MLKWNKCRQWTHTDSNTVPYSVIRHTMGCYFAAQGNKSCSSPCLAAAVFKSGISGFTVTSHLFGMFSLGPLLVLQMYRVFVNYLWSKLLISAVAICRTSWELKKMEKWWHMSWDHMLCLEAEEMWKGETILKHKKEEEKSCCYQALLQ